MNLLKSKVTFFLITLFLFNVGTALHASAESAIQCHCFKNRSYNPADKFASDDYILATSFNSLLSKYFGIPKKQIIMIKMGEKVAQDDLLIGLKISKITGEEVSNILGLKRSSNTWADTVSGLPQQEKVKTDQLLEAVRAGMPVEEAGDRVADEIIARFYRISPAEINKLRVSGLNEKEMSLLYILVHVGGRKPQTLVEQYKKQGRSWSEIAYSSGLEPSAAGKLILAYPAKKITE